MGNDRKDHGGCRYSLDGFSRSINSLLFAENSGRKLKKKHPSGNSIPTFVNSQQRSRTNSALRLHRFLVTFFSPSCYNIVDFSICALLLSTSKMETVMEVIPMQIISLKTNWMLCNGGCSFPFQLHRFRNKSIRYRYKSHDSLESKEKNRGFCTFELWSKPNE